MLVSALAQPRPLAEAAGQVGDPIGVLPVLFHLLWLGNGTVLAASADPLEAT